MLPNLNDVAENLTPLAWVGIPVALVGAVFLSVGAQLQHRGVGRVEALTPGDSSPGLNLKQLVALARRPSWLFGSLMLGLAVVFQLTSLGLSPLTLVQPLGAVALVVTAIMNAKISQVRIDGHSIRAISLCVGGVGIFVTIAAFTTTTRAVTDAQLVVILIILAVVTVLFGALFVMYRTRLKALIYIIGAGVIYGFVATLAKVVIERIKTDDFEWLTLLCLVALVAATVLGGFFVQNAYASGPPDLVIAGLTVIDPLIAVTIGIVVLNEAAGASIWTIVGFVFAGLIAVFGVFDLSKHHPQSQH